jgi:hypothetical protein
MMLTGENRRTLRIFCLSDCWSTTDPKCIDVGLNLSPFRKRPAAVAWTMARLTGQCKCMYFSLVTALFYSSLYRQSSTMLNLGAEWWWMFNATPLRPLYSRERDPVFIPLVQKAGWDPRAGLDGFGKFRSHRGSNPEPSSPYQVAMPYAVPCLIEECKPTKTCLGPE